MNRPLLTALILAPLMALVGVIGVLAVLVRGMVR